jgi:hypothetical protein
MAHRVYDHSYRDIFSEPDVVRDLIKAFVRVDKDYQITEASSAAF